MTINNNDSSNDAASRATAMPSSTTTTASSSVIIGQVVASIDAASENGATVLSTEQDPGKVRNRPGDADGCFHNNKDEKDALSLSNLKDCADEDNDTQHETLQSNPSTCIANSSPQASYSTATTTASQDTKLDSDDKDLKPSHSQEKELQGNLASRATPKATTKDWEAFNSYHDNGDRSIMHDGTQLWLTSQLIVNALSDNTHPREPLASALSELELSSWSSIISDTGPQPLPHHHSGIRGSTSPSLASRQSRPGAYSHIVGSEPVRLVPASTSSLHSMFTTTNGSATTCSSNSMEQDSPVPQAMSPIPCCSPLPNADRNRNRNHNHNLIEATPVTEDDQSTLVQASPHYEQQPRDQQKQTAKEHNASFLKNLFIWLLLLGVFCVGFAVVIAWSVGGLDNDPPSTVIPSVQPIVNGTTSSPQEPLFTEQLYLKGFLPEETLHALEDATTPQSKAFQWLYRDPSLLHYTSLRIRQRFALATFYYATGGHASWIKSNHWLQYDIHECDWYFEGAFKIFGFEQTAESPCQGLAGNNYKDANKEEYKLLWMIRNNITGIIPNELYWLTSLESIDFGVNKLSGTISHNISNLKSLRQFSIVGNEISGTFPTGLVALSDTLEVLYIAQNKLHGHIPNEISRLSNLVQLTVQSNAFSGVIPTGVGRLTDLVVLGWAHTLVTGTIPTEVGLLQSLRWAYMSGNTVTGSLPTELALMSNLAWILIEDNALTGTLPTELAMLSATLTELNLSSNYFTGRIPTEVGAWSGVYHLDLSQNQFAGPIPTEIGELKNMNFLRLSQNQFTGRVPSELGSMTIGTSFGTPQNRQRRAEAIQGASWVDPVGFQELLLNDNILTGELPSELGLLSYLEIFNVANNLLSGTIPSEISLASWPNISYVNVSFNELISGTIPASFCHSLNDSMLDFDCTVNLCGCGCACL